MNKKYRMKEVSKLLISIFFIVIFDGCALKGYKIDLKKSGPNDLLLSLRNVIIEKGFEPNHEPERVYSENRGMVERYKKDFGNITRTFFDRKADYSVHIDLFHRDCEDSIASNCELDIYVYNVYVGNDPKMKPVLIKEADNIETFLRKVAPDRKINRSEALAGVPII